MNSEDRLYATVFTLIGIILLVVMVLVYKDCERTDLMRAQCIKDPKNSANDCRTLFPQDGDKR